MHISNMRQLSRCNLCLISAVHSCHVFTIFTRSPPPLLCSLAPALTPSVAAAPPSSLLDESPEMLRLHVGLIREQGGDAWLSLLNEIQQQSEGQPHPPPPPHQVSTPCVQHHPRPSPHQVYLECCLLNCNVTLSQQFPTLSLPRFPFVRRDVLSATSSLPHLIVFSTRLCLLSSSSSLPPLLPSNV